MLDCYNYLNGLLTKAMLKFVQKLGVKCNPVFDFLAKNS